MTSIFGQPENKKQRSDSKKSNCKENRTKPKLPVSMHQNKILEDF